MSKDIKDIVIFIAIILFNIVTINLAIVLLLSSIAISENISNNVYNNPCILADIIMIITVIITILSPIITTIAIKKAKGKYLRSFFDNIKYPTILLFLIISLFWLIFYFDKNYSEKCIVLVVCQIVLYSIFAFGMLTKNIKKIIIFASIMIFFYLIIALVIKDYSNNFFKSIMFASPVITCFLSYLTILWHKFIKFIENKIW